jgi:undecaprenyl-diphosphatase
MNEIIEFDKNLLIFLNNLGNSRFDEFWLFITKQLNLTPLFIFIGFLIQKKIGWKNLGILILILLVLFICTDQITNLFKNNFQRLRPCADDSINHLIRVVHFSNSYSFFSGHAANSMASTTLIFLILKKHYKYIFIYFTFPLIFAYSRIYLGVHYPIDIFTGYLFGALMGFLFYLIYKKLERK